MSKIKDLIRKNMYNIPGWRSSRKIVVIESDDWGSVRIRDKKAYEALKQKGLNVDDKRFDQVDTLESNQDLEFLFEVLHSVRDSKGNPAKFTPMCLLGNPDFEKIKASDYTRYFFQPLAETLAEFPESDRVLKLWKEGVQKNIFIPQLHGREHVNVRRYMDILQNHEAKEGLRFALDYHSVGPSAYKGTVFPNYLGALHPVSKTEIGELKQHLVQAGEFFESYLGYKPQVFMAPNAEEPKELEATLKDIGVQYLSRSKRRIYPKGDGEFGKEWNFFGKVTQHKQLILNRNAFFEPTKSHHIAKNHRGIDECLKEVEIAFHWGKPAVISSHRANYISGVFTTNRDQGIRDLRILLQKLLNNWPDIEFMTSNELGDLIKKSKKHIND